MDEVNKIRKSFFTDGESKNAIAKRFNRSWETIDRIVSMSREELENRGCRPNRKSKVMTDKVLKAINAYLDEEKEKGVKKKQRYTARKIYKDLKEKGIYEGSEKQMQNKLRELRKERNQLKTQSFLPLSFPLGSSLQIDHGEVDLMINENRVTGYLFIASVPGHVLRYCQIFPTKSSEAWGEFHERALRFFGGVFTKLVYDNDSVLVKKVIGSNRDQTTFSLSLEEHFGFESHFCNLAAGNEKGAVENGVGYCRRNFLPGCPSFSDWDEVNQHLLTSCERDIKEGKHYKTKQSLQSTFEELREKLKPLPPRKSWCKWMSNCRVDSCQLVSIDNHDYSVPEKYVGSSVRVGLGIFQVKMFKDEDLIAMHERKHDDNDSLILDHYLDQLQYKSSALWDCKAVNGHEFDPRFLEIWKQLAEKFPKKEANRQFVRILLLRRRYSKENLLKAIEESLKAKAIDYVVVESIVRQLDMNHQAFKEEELSEMLLSVNIYSWEFDLSIYAELCEEVGS